MIGGSVMGGVIFGGGPAPSLTVLTPDRFVFNGYSLHRADGTIRMLESNHDDVGDIDLVTFDAPRIDGGGVLGHYYHKKNIDMVLSLHAGTEEALNDLLDDFKANTRKTNGWLEIVVNGEVRRVMASIASLKFNRKYFNITFVQDVQITFTTLDPHWSKKDAESLTYLGVSSNFTEDIINNGTVATYPQFYFLFGAVSSLTTMTVTINGYALTLSQTITSGGILMIDGVEKTVKYNGVAIDYTGTFPPLDVGSNPVQFDFGGGVFTTDMVIVYSKKYK